MWVECVWAASLSIFAPFRISCNYSHMVYQHAYMQATCMYSKQVIRYMKQQCIHRLNERKYFYFLTLTILADYKLTFFQITKILFEINDSNLA